VYRDPYRRIERRVADFGAFRKEYFVTVHPLRAALLVVRGGEALLARQYRLLVDRVAWEVPGGAVEAGESPEAAALRECREETGVRCGSARPLLAVQPSVDTWH